MPSAHNAPISVGAVNDAVSYYLTHPGVSADDLAESLCRIFAP